jgi:predicted HicB family RNase H-like nuclease
VTAIIEDFHHAVDEYLDFCAANDTPPEKPFKSSFNVRVGADLHCEAALMASARGVSLSALVEEALRQTVNQ